MTYNQKTELAVKLQPFFKLNQQWQDLILGGSLALMLQDKIPYRSGGDIDLVGHRYFVWEKQELCQMGSSIEDSDCILIKIDGVAYDFFVRPNVLYSIVELNGIRINVQNPGQIIDAKLKYFNKYKIMKHRDDLLAYFDIDKNGMKEQAQTTPSSYTDDDDLPF